MVKKLILIALVTLILVSCSPVNYWTEEQTKAAWENMRLPAKCLSGMGYMTGYAKYWFMDADGDLIVIEGRGLFFVPGTVYDR